MTFYSIRDLKNRIKSLWQSLSSGDEVIITSNGKPSAIMVGIPEGEFDETVQAIRQAKAMIAVNRMRAKAAKAGYKSDDEIEVLIEEAGKQD